MTTIDVHVQESGRVPDDFGCVEFLLLQHAGKWGWVPVETPQASRCWARSVVAEVKSIPGDYTIHRLNYGQFSEG